MNLMLLAAIEKEKSPTKQNFKPKKEQSKASSTTEDMNQDAEMSED